MKRVSIFVAILAVANAALGFAGAESEPAAEASDEGMATFLELPVEGQAEYNLDDYVRLTGKAITAFSESPLLAERVAAGELPAVAERLPQDILVRVPLHEIGTYGGTITLPIANLSNPFPGNQMITDMLFVLDLRNPGNVAPGVASGYEVSADGKTFTLYLREGMKWSDGAPYGSDDFLFWWEDVTLNEQITPSVPSIWRPDDQMVAISKVDDLTVQYVFQSAQFNAPYYFAQNDHIAAQQGRSYLPRHALEKYHVKYNSDAGKLAAEAGFEEWWQLFREKARTAYGTQVVEGIPVVVQYILESEFENGRTYVRNPYYHGIDPAGNQLPYIDRVRTIAHEDNMQTLKLRTIAGDYDYSPFTLNTTDLPLLASNAEQGGYHAFLGKGGSPNDQPLLINQNNQEPVLGDLLRDRKFRHALSFAINRQELVDVIALGMATPTQTTVNPTNSLFEQRYADAYIEYDPDQANRMLDELGLTERDGEGFRVLSNGKTLSLLIEPTTTFSGSVETAELVKEYWEAIGIKIAIKTGTYGTVFGRGGSVPAGTFHVTIVLTDFGAETMWRTPGYWNGPRNVMRINWSAPLWDQWWQTDGAEGIEPPPEVARIFDLAENMYRFPDDEWRAAGKEILDWWAENFYTIGTFGYQQAPMTANVKLGNVDFDTYHTAPSDFGKGYLYRLWQFYWKE